MGYPFELSKLNNSSYFSNVLLRGAEANYGSDPLQQSDNVSSLNPVDNNQVQEGKGVKTERLLNKAVIQSKHRTIEDGDRTFAEEAAKKLGFTSVKDLADQVEKLFTERTEDRKIQIKVPDLLSRYGLEVATAVLSSATIRDALELMEQGDLGSNVQHGTEIGPNTIKEVIVSTLGLINEGKLNPEQGDHIAFVNERILDSNDPNSMAVIASKVTKLMNDQVNALGQCKQEVNEVLKSLTKKQTQIREDVRQLIAEEFSAGLGETAGKLLEKLANSKGTLSETIGALLSEVEACTTLSTKERTEILNALAGLLTDAFDVETRETKIQEAVDRVKSSTKGFQVGPKFTPEQEERRMQLLAQLDGVREQVERFKLPEGSLARKDMTLSKMLHELLEKYSDKLLEKSIEEVNGYTSEEGIESLDKSIDEIVDVEGTAIDEGLAVALKSLADFAEKLENELSELELGASSSFEKYGLSGKQANSDPEAAALMTMLKIKEQLNMKEPSAAELEEAVKAQNQLVEVLVEVINEQQMEVGVNESIGSIGSLSLIQPQKATMEDFKSVLNENKNLRRLLSEQLTLTGRKAAEHQIFRELEKSLANITSSNKNNVYNGAQHELEFSVEIGAAFKLAGLVDFRIGARIGYHMELTIDKDRMVSVLSGECFELAAGADVGLKLSKGVELSVGGKARGGVQTFSGRTYNGVQEMLENSTGDLMLSMIKLNSGNFHRMNRLRKLAGKADNQRFVNELVSKNLLDRTDNISFVRTNRKASGKVDVRKIGGHVHGGVDVSIGDKDILETYGEANVHHVKRTNTTVVPIINQPPRMPNGKIKTTFTYKERSPTDRATLLQLTRERLSYLIDFQQACKYELGKSFFGKYDPNISAPKESADEHFNRFLFHAGHPFKAQYTTKKYLSGSSAFSEYAALGLRSYAIEVARLQEEFMAFRKEATDDEIAEFDLMIKEMQDKIYNPDFHVPLEKIERLLYCTKKEAPETSVEWSIEFSVEHPLGGGIAVELEGERPTGLTQEQLASPFRPRESITAKFSLSNVSGMEILAKVINETLLNASGNDSTLKKIGDAFLELVSGVLGAENKITKKLDEISEAADFAKEISQLAHEARQKFIDEQLQKLAKSQTVVTEEMMKELEKSADEIEQSVKDQAAAYAEEMQAVLNQFIQVEKSLDQRQGIKLNLLRGDDGHLHIDSMDFFDSKFKENNLRFKALPTGVSPYVEFGMKQYDEVVMRSRIGDNTFGSLIDMYDAWADEQVTPGAWRAFVTKNGSAVTKILNKSIKALHSGPKDDTHKLSNLGRELLTYIKEVDKVKDLKAQGNLWCRLSEATKALTLYETADEQRKVELRDEAFSKIMQFLSELRKARAA